jgi:putative tributyrin esterase
MTRKFLLGLSGWRIGLQGVCSGSALFAIILFCTIPCSAQTAPRVSLGPAKTHSGVTLRDASFHSASLSRDMHYRVLLPANYDASARRYPTLFLLHGLYGDDQNWSTRTNLVNYSRGLNLIIAMPDAGNSWYVNSATNPEDKYEDYIVKDFIAEIDTRYRTIREGYARAIAGLSMGGYAAVKFSLKYPSLFAYSGGISAALDASADLDETHPEFRDNLRKAFGEPGNPVRSQNDVVVLLLHADTKALPYFYLDCGSDDSFLDVNRKFVSRLQQLKAPYEFHELQGGHTWDYWDAAIERFLYMLTKSDFARGAIRTAVARPIERRP